MEPTLSAVRTLLSARPLPAGPISRETIPEHEALIVAGDVNVVTICRVMTPWFASAPRRIVVCGDPLSAQATVSVGSGIVTSPAAVVLVIFEVKVTQY